jgi:uncharacterized protein
MKLRISNPARNQLLATAADLAESQQQKATGLLNRVALVPGEGLLIPDASSIHTKGMSFPIDVVFLDSTGQVLDVLAGLSPGGHAERDNATAVLELPAGMIAASATQTGDMLQFAPAETLKGSGYGYANVLGLLENYKLVKPGTCAAIGNLFGHVQKVRDAFLGAGQ